MWCCIREMERIVLCINSRSFMIRLGNCHRRHMSRQINNIQEIGAYDLSFLTCGNIEQVYYNFCQHQSSNLTNNNHNHKSDALLRRMTSIVESPHCVAPEVISQSSHNTEDNNKQYLTNNTANNKYSMTIRNNRSVKLKYHT